MYAMRQGGSMPHRFYVNTGCRDRVGYPLIMGCFYCKTTSILHVWDIIAFLIGRFSGAVQFSLLLSDADFSGNGERSSE